jgi:ribosomal protein L18E
MFPRTILTLFLAATLLHLTSCKKESFGPLTDSKPEVPVTVANVYEYRPAPTVKASKAENKITITLQIPSNSGRTIKEVTKIAASTTANFTAIYSGTVVGTGTSQLWSATPIAVNATSYTFTTTFDEYRTKTGTAAAPASNALLGRDFYFALTLDNGQTVIPQNTRVWVVD